MTGRHVVLLAGSVITASLLAACGEGASDPTFSTRLGSATSAIQGGRSDTEHAFVVGIASRMGGVCTGTLIAPNLVLTARHCVVRSDGEAGVTCADKFGRTVGPENFYVTTSPQLSQSAKFYEATSVRVPDETGFCGNDIALIQLAKNIPESEAKPAIPVVHVSMADARFSRTLTVLGYGATSASETGEGAGVRRIKSNIDVLCIPGDPAGCGELPRYMESSSDREFITEGGTCSGDSGGPAFDQVTFQSGGLPYVFGALSRGPQYDGRCLEAVYTRTDAFTDLIVAEATAAAQAGGYPAPAWIDAKAWEVEGGPGTLEAGSKAEGEACSVDEECVSAACRDAGTGSLVCVAACSDEVACATGTTCVEGGCLPTPKPAAAATPKVASSGETASAGICSVPGGVGMGARSGSSAAGLAVAAALVLARRRRVAARQA